MAAPFQGPFSIQVESWVYNTGIAFNRERGEWKRGKEWRNKGETVRCSLGAGAEEDGVGSRGWEGWETPGGSGASPPCPWSATTQPVLCCWDGDFSQPRGRDGSDEVLGWDDTGI